MAHSHDKKGYVIHIGNLKQALNHGLVLKKNYRVIKFNQKMWLKLYIEMTTELTAKAKKMIPRDFFKLMNNSIFRKVMENVIKQT